MKSRIRTKLCGIRSAKDLEVAREAGVDAMGLLVETAYPTEDEVGVEEARHLLRGIDDLVTVLVTHERHPRRVLEMAHLLNVDTVQLHGLPSPAEVRSVYKNREGRRITRAVHVEGESTLFEAETYAVLCDGIHLDTRTDDRLGGTGQTHDWTVSAAVVARLEGMGCPCVLAGGLTPENVGRAIRQVHPYAVDVNSGVETAAGDKSRKRVVDFVQAAHLSARALQGTRPLRLDPLGAR
jgi:phosphoribosylanthranilate isomerase